MSSVMPSNIGMPCNKVDPAIIRWLAVHGGTGGDATGDSTVNDAASTTPSALRVGASVVKALMLVKLEIRIDTKRNTKFLVSSASQ